MRQVTSNLTISTGLLAELRKTVPGLTHESRLRTLLTRWTNSSANEQQAAISEVVSNGNRVGARRRKAVAA